MSVVKINMFNLNSITNSIINNFSWLKNVYNQSQYIFLLPVPVFYLVWIVVPQCGHIHLDSAKRIIVHLLMVCQHL